MKVKPSRKEKTEKMYSDAERLNNNQSGRKSRWAYPAETQGKSARERKG